MNPAGEFTRQTRGAAWMHTAVRENFMAAQLDASMGPAGILGANGAMGIYRYDAPNQPFGPAVSVPACIVETTRGDRRLGSHVLAGIELLLPLLLDAGGLDRAALLGCFPAARAALPAGGDPVVGTASLMCDHMMASEFIAQGMMAPGTHGLEFDVPRDATSLADGAAAALPHSKLEPGAYPQQWTCEGPQAMGPAWHPLWDRCVAAKGEYPIVAPVRGEVKTNGTYGLSVSVFCFRGPLTGLIIGYPPIGAWRSTTPASRSWAGARCSAGLLTFSNTIESPYNHHTQGY